MFRFKQRLSPPDFKELTQDLAIRQMSPPQEVVLPLLQHTGAAAEPRMAPGDKVKVGTTIAEACGYVSVPVHASVSGEVLGLEVRPHPVLGEAPAIVLKSDGLDSPEGRPQAPGSPASLSGEEILEMIRSAGIVGLGGAAFPTHVKLKPPKEKHIDAFILNGAECEPYITADHRLLLERGREILAGMEIAMRVLKVSAGYVAIEANKPDAIALFKKLVSGSKIRVVTLASFYPQGAEKQLIRTVFGREVPAGGLPFDVGVVVNNAATCLAIYEAVDKNKPLYERVITVTGAIVRHPANLRVRLGTKVKDILEFCGGLSEEPAKIILGGPMMGLAQYTTQVPVIKSTTGILVLNQEQARIPEEEACIRCGACVRACPLNLVPCLINLAAEKGLWKEAQAAGALDCFECGLCAYLCPANRRIIQAVKKAKHNLK